MTLQEAIEILTIHNDHNPNFTNAEREEAHQLGIEALKAIRRQRNSGPTYKVRLLPGESVITLLHGSSLNSLRQQARNKTQ